MAVRTVVLPVVVCISLNGELDLNKLLNCVVLLAVLSVGVFLIARDGAINKMRHAVTPGVRPSKQILSTCIEALSCSSLCVSVAPMQTLRVSSGCLIGGALTADEEALLDAAGSGDVKRVRRKLMRGTDVNCKDWEGVTALFTASYQGRTGVVRLLLGVPGVDVNIPIKGNVVPIHVAVQNGHIQIVRLLLAVGSLAINAVDDYAVTSLYMACQKGFVEMVRLLLATPGVDVNVAKYDGFTPLHVATQKGYTEIVRLLLAVDGIAVNATDDMGSAPLSLAAHQGCLEIVKLLLAAPGIDVNVGKNIPNALNPVMAAVASGNPDIVHLIMNTPGVDIDVRAPNGSSFLQFVSDNAHRVGMPYPPPVVTKPPPRGGSSVHRTSVSAAGSGSSGSGGGAGGGAQVHDDNILAAQSTTAAGVRIPSSDDFLPWLSELKELGVVRCSGAVFLSSRETNCDWAAPIRLVVKKKSRSGGTGNSGNGKKKACCRIVFDNRR